MLMGSSARFSDWSRVDFGPGMRGGDGGLWMDGEILITAAGIMHHIAAMDHI